MTTTATNLEYIPVTAEHIERGIQQDCHMCPVAYAIYDAGYKECEVNNAWLQLDDPDCTLYFYEGDLMCRVMDFDDLGRMDPFLLVIDRESMTAYSEDV